MSTTENKRWAAAGPAGGDVPYRIRSLGYGAIEMKLSESVPLAALFKLWLIAAVSSVVVFMFFLVIWVAAFADSAAEGDAKLGVLSTGTFLAFATFWAVLLLSRTDEPIDEWKTLVENKHEAATSAYAAIYASLRRRRIPVNAAAMRIRSDVLAPEVVNNRLVINERSYTVYTSVFPYGTSLYIGWMMWRSRRGATLIGQLLKDLIGSMLGRTGSINQMLRTERVRAMREAVHTAVREGADVAIQGIRVSLPQTFGHDIPVQDLRGDTPEPSVPSGIGG
uniref:adhesin n=1 Tax=Paractinoplanes polyasparticus TaxID=2856853 RepID=UPI001C86112C|nr:adhesin [Actinoplanes polyasparticus]